MDRYEYLFEHSVDPILVIEDGRFTDCNRAAVDMLGVAHRDDIIGRYPWDISPEFQPDGQRSEEKGRNMLETLETEVYQSFEWMHTRADGSTFPVEVSLTSIPVEGGQRLHVSWRDITDRKRLEKELRHSQKMEAVGKLAGAIAHDFNNQLMPILGYADLLEHGLDSSDPAHEWALAIQRSARLSATLVERLLTFSHKRNVEPESLDLAALVDGMHDAIGKLVGEGIAVSLSVPSAPLWVRMGHGEIEQIVLNLASNARDAMTGGGALSITVKSDDCCDEGGVRLIVEDTGSGMDETTVASVFEPYFTTKTAGRGTGLGLSIVQELVRQAGGFLEVKSAPGEGTRISVCLPQAMPRVDSEQPEATSTRALALTGRRVLVFEDDPGVMELVRVVLEDAGAVVHAAQSREEAFSHLADRMPDVMLVDVQLADTTGPAFVAGARSRGVTAPFLFISGSADEELIALGLAPSSDILLRKPFSPSVLLDVLSRLVTSDTPSNGENRR